MSNRKYRTPARHQPLAGSHSAVDQPERQPDPDRDQAVKEAYRRLGGERIDADVARLERLLQVHDHEVSKLLAGAPEGKGWRVSPAMVMRIQREIEELLERRAELLAQAERHADGTDDLPIMLRNMPTYLEWERKQTAAYAAYTAKGGAAPGAVTGAVTGQS